MSFGIRHNPTQQYWEELLGVHSTMGRLVEIWTPNSNWLNQARVGVDHATRPIARAECSPNGNLSNPSGVGQPARAVDGVAGPNYLTQYGLNSGAPGCGIPTISINGFTGAAGLRKQPDRLGGPDSGRRQRLLHAWHAPVQVRYGHPRGEL